MKKATKILFSTALTAGMLFTGVQLWNLQAQEETSEANAGITLQEAAADTNTAQNGNRLRKRDGSCLDGNNTANNPNCDGTQQGKQNSFQNTKDTNTAQNGNRLRKKDGSCLDGNNTVNNPNGNGNGMRQRKQDGSGNNPNCPRKNM